MNKESLSWNSCQHSFEDRYRHMRAELSHMAITTMRQIPLELLNNEECRSKSLYCCTESHNWSIIHRSGCWNYEMINISSQIRSGCLVYPMTHYCRILTAFQRAAFGQLFHRYSWNRYQSYHQQFCMESGRKIHSTGVMCLFPCSDRR